MVKTTGPKTPGSRHYRKISRKPRLPDVHKRAATRPRLQGSTVLVPSRTLTRRRVAPVPLRGILGRHLRAVLCHRQVGTEECRARSNKGMTIGSSPTRLASGRIKHLAALQQSTGQLEQSVSYAAESTTI